MTPDFRQLNESGLLVNLQRARQNWGWLLLLGILLTFGGVAAIGASTFTTYFTVLFLGALLVITGIVKAISSFWLREWQGFGLGLFGGLLYIVVGGLFLARPVATAIGLTLIMAILFIFSGLARILSPLWMKFEGSGWLVVSGICSLILGILVLSEWPLSGLWVIGLFLGIDLILYGWTWIFVALMLSRAPKIKA